MDLPFQLMDNLALNGSTWNYNRSILKCNGSTLLWLNRVHIWMARPCFRMDRPYMQGDPPCCQWTNMIFLIDIHVLTSTLHPLDRPYVNLDNLALAWFVPALAWISIALVRTDLVLAYINVTLACFDHSLWSAFYLLRLTLLYLSKLECTDWLYLLSTKHQP